VSDAVTYEREGDVGVLTMRRPDNRNSMTSELLDAFAIASRRAREDRGARCVIVTGTGRCFSAGADFKSQIQRAGEDQRPHERSYAMYEPFLSILDIEVPVIAAMNGHAIGGGFGLALVCDIRVASTEAKYGANFARLGLSPGMAISYLLPRLVGASRAAELLYTGRLLTGEEAERVGLASRSVPADQVAEVALEMAGAIAANAPIAVRATKELLRVGLGWEAKRAARHEAFAQADSVATRDAQEGIAALLDKREPRFDGT
jgi:enoyl-CoA hydratase/carnithine racemase